MLQTPVLFLVFNRPETTRRVFDVIRQKRPTQLFVAADGPREGREGEAEKCEQVRRIATAVDWPCEVHTLFRNQNLGCGVAPAQAITWFFEQVEEGIILEDDCLPNLSFFEFCEVLLDRYRNHMEVMHIGGFNLQLGHKRGNDSYFYSRYTHIWGWATWRRAWAKYDFEIKSYLEFKKSNQITKITNNKKEQDYWLQKFALVAEGKRKDIWDYQWLFCCWLRNGITIVPNVNLISNIGFGDEATHTTTSSILSNLPTESLSELSYPISIKLNFEADQFIFEKFHSYNNENIVVNVKNKLAKRFPFLLKLNSIIRSLL
jgi:hypothetical protein